MNNEFINKLLAAGFDVQTQNQGAVVTVSYTQAGPSFDSNLKEIEEKFKLFVGANTPVNFNDALGQPSDAAIAGDCKALAAIIRSETTTNHTLTIGSWYWHIFGMGNGYRLTINPDCAISVDEMQYVGDFIKTQLDDRWAVIFVNRVHGIEIVKPDCVATYFTNLLKAVQGLPHIGVLNSDASDFCDELGLIFRTPFLSGRVIVIDGWEWSISENDGKYRLTINPDSGMAYGEMLRMCAKIETGMVGWDVYVSIRGNGHPGIGLTKREDSNEIN